MQASLIVPETKVCSKCKTTKPLADFNRDRTRKDGLFPQCKDCLKAYREANVEKRRAAQRVWHEVHKEEEHQKRRARIAANPEAYKARRKAAYNAEPEVRRARTKTYADANREKVRATNRAYFQTPEGREKLRHNMHNRRVAKTGAGNTLTLTTADLVRRQGGKCYYCQQRFTKQRKPELEHIVPLSKGGPNSDDNVVAACRACNGRKHAKDPASYAREIGRLLI